MIIQSILGILLLASIFILSIQIYLFKNQNNAILTGFLSMLAIVFGAYLWIMNGVILEYGSEKEIIQSNASWLFTIGVLNLLSGLGFVFLSISRFLFYYLKKWSLGKS